jgi:hypothetical protein
VFENALNAVSRRAIKCKQEGGNAGVKEGSVRRGHDIAKPKRKINKRKRTKGAQQSKALSKAPKKRRKRKENGQKITGNVSNAYCFKMKRNWRGL